MKLIWWGLLALVLYAHPSHAVPMSQCPDNSHWYPTSVGSSFCPPTITIEGTAPSTTSATITGEVGTAAGTVYVSIRLSCTPLQWRDVHNGLGDEASGTDADVTSGLFSINVTGLAEGTTYCAHVGQWNAGKPAKPKTVEFTTTETGGSTGDSITGGDDWFFCPDGSGANSGLTHALRKATIPATDIDLVGAGDDIWLCTGGVWSSIKHTIARQGSSGDYNEMGTYYNDAGTPRKAVDGIRGAGTEHTKATINGGLNQACIDARTCTYPATGFPRDGGLTSIYDAHLVLAVTADYTDIRNIQISYTRYGTILYSGTVGSTGSLHHLIFDGVDLTYTGHQASLVGTDGVQDIVVRNGHSYFASTCFMLKQSPRVSSDISACDAGASPYWPVGYLQITRSPNHRALFENNDGERMFGEGIGIYNNQGSGAYSIWRGNRIMNTWSDNFYVDGTAHVVIENNIGVGGNGNMDSVVDGVGAFACIHIGSESTNFVHPVGMVVRNNLCVGGGSGINGYLFDDATSGGDQIGSKNYGNTIIASRDLDMWYLEPVANTTEWVNTGNVFWSEPLGTNPCADDFNAGTYLDNHWYGNPADSGCDGSGDTYGAPGLTASAYSTWTTYNNQSGASPSWPTFADANPAGGSAVLGTGTQLNSAILDVANFGFSWAQMTSPPSESNWECALCVDATGAVRANPPSKGAVE